MGGTLKHNGKGAASAAPNINQSINRGFSAGVALRWVLHFSRGVLLEKPEIRHVPPPFQYNHFLMMIAQLT
jgi:hypothetical protein